MIDVKEFKRYLAIDKNALDEEIVRQPSLLYEVSEAYSEAAAERDGLKEDIGVTDGMLDGDFRIEHDKATEGAIKAKIIAHRDHIKAFGEWVDAKRKADRLLALKEAYQQRGYMLRDLVSLYTSNYFQVEAVKSTASQEDHVYRARRARIAEARK